jgi:hypothetical protein
MLHKSIQIKEFLVKDESSFKLRVKHYQIPATPELFSLDFVQENYDVNGNFTEASTYNFFLTKEQIGTLCKNLIEQHGI